MPSKGTTSLFPTNHYIGSAKAEFLLGYSSKVGNCNFVEFRVLIVERRHVLSLYPLPP